MFPRFEWLFNLLVWVAAVYVVWVAVSAVLLVL
jgi:hypothetical protein